MKKQSSVVISLRTSQDISDKDIGKSLIEIFSSISQLAPEWLSIDEKFRDRFISVEDFINNWWAMPTKTEIGGRLVSKGFWGPFWKRKSSLTNMGNVEHRRENKFGDVSPAQIWWSCAWDDTIDYDNIFTRLASLFPTDVGMMHLFTPFECDPVTRVEGFQSFLNCSFGGKMNPRIANIGWAMVYGEGGLNYIREVNRNRIEDAGFIVDDCRDSIMIKTTSDIADVERNFELFSKRRVELKSMFREDFFSIQLEPHIL